MKRNEVLILVSVAVVVISIVIFTSIHKPESISLTVPQIIQSVNKTNQNLSAVTPSITLSSDKAVARSTISVSGRGFVQSAPVKITLPDNSAVNMVTSPGTYFSTLGMSGKYGTDNEHFGYPESVALDSSENIYVVDRGNDRVQKFSSSGKYIFTLGVSGKSDTDNSHFNTPVSVALDSSGNIYVADTYNHRIQKFSSAGTYLSTLGVSGQYGTDNAHFSYPEGVALDSSGNIYVADTYNHRIQKFSSTGTYLSTLGISGEFGTDNSHFCYPANVVLDASGNIYVADSGNNRIQKFSSAGAYLSTLGVSMPYMSTAGMSGKSDTIDSHFRTPEGVALDSSGNIYVADTYNHRIQKFSSTGTYLSTLGVPGQYGSDNSHFGYPASVTLDSSGNIYVADFDNNRVQKFTPTGSFETHVIIPSLTLGNYVISATDGNKSASAAFSLVSDISANETVQTSTGPVNASNTPAFYLLSHGISVKDAIQKSKGPVNASNTFAFFLLSNIVQKDKGNIFFSPYSISDAFSMAYEGARNQTESEIQSVFGFADRQTQRESIKVLDSKINSPNANYTLNIANALWVQKNFPILEEYSSSLDKYYSAKSENLDFIQNPEESRSIINKWVEDKTAQKIKDLLPEGSINDLVRVVLTDAVYFKGTWLTKFDESQTRDANFSVSENNTIKVPMMHVETGFKYLEDGDLKILDMPYSGGNLSMMVILPKDKDLNHLVSILSSDKLNQWKNNLAVREVSVHMPKFTIHTKYELKENLSEMGMPSAFDENADFSGITGTNDLYIDQVYHKAFVDVDEKGTEAAAATAIVFMAVMGENAGVQPLEFNADHPFVFLIYDNQTGLILFAGQIVDPTK